MTNASAATFSASYLSHVAEVARQIDPAVIEKMAIAISDIRSGGGRLFFLGVGGGAGNASHAVNDFRKLAGIESYAPSDNVSELTARINDDGWESAYAAWLHGSRLSAKDGIMVFSVGGGDEAKNVSLNLVRAVDYARSTGAKIFGLVGRDGGHTAKNADVCVVVPTVAVDLITAMTESYQAVIWHLLAFHPLLRRHEGKWESLR
jgi:D-sedoheptulose 7-phosphate isomerase